MPPSSQPLSLAFCSNLLEQIRVPMYSWLPVTAAVSPASYAHAFNKQSL